MNLNLKLNLCSLANNDNKTLLINNCSFPKSFLTACSFLFCSVFLLFFLVLLLLLLFFFSRKSSVFLKHLSSDMAIIS